MERFDERFHDIDPITQRPFSAGHPDGVWMITILFEAVTLLSAIPAVIEAVKVFSGSVPDPAGFIPVTLCLIVFAPPVILLFLRRKLAYIWLSALALVAVTAAAGVYFGPVRAGEAPIQTFWGSATTAAAFVLIAVYTRGLKRDQLLL